MINGDAPALARGEGSRSLDTYPAEAEEGEGEALHRGEGLTLLDCALDEGGKSLSACVEDEAFPRVRVVADADDLLECECC